MRFRFFNYISYHFGHNSVLSFKSWIKYRKIIIKSRLKAEFLRKCIRLNIIPRHLSTILPNFSTNLTSSRSISALKLCRHRFIRKLLQIELSDTYSCIRSAHTHIFKISRSLYRDIPMFVCNSFFTRQHRSLYSFFTRQQEKLINKFNRLLSEHYRDTRDIRPVRYFYCPPSQSDSDHNVNFSFKPVNNRNGAQGWGSEVRVDPSCFKGRPQLPLPLNKKWFVNLSSIQIPEDVQCLLQLGDNFSLPFSNRDKLTMDFIKNIECSLTKLPSATQITIRNRSINIINNLPNYSFPESDFNTYIRHLFSSCKEFFKRNDNLIVTRADKGNITVALDKHEYFNKIEELLMDTNTYNVVKKDPTKNLTSRLRDLLTRWKSSEFISPSTYRSLYCSDGLLPRAYGLPKVHKPGCPFRLIVSSVNSPLYNLASFLHCIMFKSFPTALSHVSNSFELVKRLSDKNINSDFRLISLDVVSLFTNVPIEMAIDSVSVRWDHISLNCNISKSEFIIAVRMILDSTFFIFNGVIYKQNFGTPMGSPLSPIIADIVLQDLEARALASLRFTPPFYVRYVDDIALAAPSHLHGHILQIFNAFHPRLQFTMEIDEENRLNFLDTTMILSGNNLFFDWYCKPTFSGRYLHFLSNHPLCQKRGTVIGLIDRVFLLSHPSFHQKNFERIIDILLDNGYPLCFIFRVLHERLKYLCYRVNSNPNDEEHREESVSYFTIPYVPLISEQFKRITKDLNVKLSYRSLNKMNSFIKVHKDSCPLSSRQNVVYRINCKDCDASYVGQTKRQLNTRISEHKNHIRRGMSGHSVITDHRISSNHDFDWDNVSVLDNEPWLRKRLISEILHIKRQKNGLNLQTDTEGLPDMYIPVLEKLSKI